MLTVAVLGPVEVRVDGELVVVPAGKNTELLVRLALSAGQAVGTDQLLSDLWPGTTTGVVKNTLQSKVSQLRRALVQPAAITGARGGYRLAVDPADVDALRVIEVAATASELRRAGDIVAALKSATEGLALFRGNPFADAGDGQSLLPHRARLDQVRLGLLEDQLAAKVQLGGGPDVIGQLEGLVALYPLRETSWFWLITALYRNDRQADALAAYAQVRKTLVNELGLEPGRALQDLEKQVLQHDLDLQRVRAEPLVGPDPGRNTTALTVGNLPRRSSPLVGRGPDLAALDTAIRDQRLVTLVGTPGVGKTHLAIEVARQAGAGGGTWLIRLDAFDDQVSIGQVVAEALSLSGEQALFNRVTGTDTLLVLDNCEHVVDAAAQFIDRLLDGTTGVRVLATSQLPLGVDGEVVYQVEPLPAAESVMLFTSRATRMRPQLIVDSDTSDDIARLCRSLDGLPLAIELAAARVKSLSIKEISRRLDMRFDILRDPTSRLPERRRALAAAIGWSYELLFPDDQRGLWALSTFSGGAPLAAVERVLGVLGVPPAVAVDVLTRLVGRSMIQVDTGDHGAVRYRLLDSIRAFASDRLQESTFREEAIEVHAIWYAENADWCAANVRGRGQPQCLDFVRAERANIDSALAWAAQHRPLLGVQIVNGLGWTWVVLGDGVAGATRIRTALSAAALPMADPARSMALLLAGWLEASAGNLDQADIDLEQAANTARSAGSQQLTSDADRHRAFLRIQQGRPAEALAFAEQSVAADQLLGRRWEQAGGQLLAAYASIMLGDTAGAGTTAEAALRLLEPIGDSWALVHGEAMLGAIAQAERRFPEATQHLSRAAESSRQLGFLGQEAYHLTRLGRVQQQAGDNELAIATLFRGLTAANTDGDLRMAATAKVHLARLLRGTDRNEIAIALLEQANQWYRTSGAGDGALLATVLLAAMTTSHSDTNHPGGPESVLEEARRVRDHEVEVLALDILARLAAESGDFGRAGQLLQFTDELNKGLAAGVDDMDRFDARLARELQSIHGRRCGD